MGGYACLKAAVDGRARVDADVTKALASTKQVLDCLYNTAMMAPAVTFDDAMEDMFLEAGARFAKAVKQAAEDYALIASGLESEARKKWPAEGAGKENKKS